MRYMRYEKNTLLPHLMRHIQRVFLIHPQARLAAGAGCRPLPPDLRACAPAAPSLPL
jgi:hypothetical protein